MVGPCSRDQGVGREALRATLENMQHTRYLNNDCCPVRQHSMHTSNIKRYRGKNRVPMPRGRTCPGGGDFHRSTCLPLEPTGNAAGLFSKDYDHSCCQLQPTQGDDPFHTECFFDAFLPGAQAKAWVGDVVVKLRLCPFAEAVFKASGGVRYVVSPAETTDGVWRDFLREVKYLVDHDREVMHSIFCWCSLYLMPMLTM